MRRDGTRLFVTEAGGLEKGVTRRGRWFCERKWEMVQGAEAKDTAQGTTTSPTTRGRNGNKSCDAIFVVVDVEAEGSGEVIFHELTEPGLAVHNAFRGTDYIVTVGKKTGGVGGRIGNYIENVPDVVGCRQRGPLKC